MAPQKPQRRNLIVKNHRQMRSKQPRPSKRDQRSQRPLAHQLVENRSACLFIKLRNIHAMPFTEACIYDTESKQGCPIQAIFWLEWGSSKCKRDACPGV